MPKNKAIIFKCWGEHTYVRTNIYPYCNIPSFLRKLGYNNRRWMYINKLEPRRKHTLMIGFPSIVWFENHCAISVNRTARIKLYSSGVGLVRPSLYLKKTNPHYNTIFMKFIKKSKMSFICLDINFCKIEIPSQGYV